MIYALNFLVLIVLSALELSVLPHFRIFGIVPLLVPFFILMLTYFRKGVEPFLLAAVAGIFFDLFSIYPFGFYLIFFMIIAAIIRIIFHEGMKTMPFLHFLVMSVMLCVVFYGAQIVMLLLSGATIKVSQITHLAVSLFVNEIYAILLYAILVWYFDKLLEWTPKARNFL